MKDEEEGLTPASLTTGPEENAPIDTGIPEKSPEPEHTYGGIPEPIINALTWQESRDNPNAQSKAGAMGIAQVMPTTWKAYGGGNPYDPEQNKEVAGRVLSDEMSRFSGNQELAFAAYNAGSPKVIAALKQAGYSLKDASDVSFDTVKNYLPSETQAYVPSIMNRIRQNTLRSPAAYTGAERNIPNSQDPANIGDADYLKKNVQDILGSSGFEDTSATEKLAALSKLWRTKPYWTEDAKVLFKKLSTVAWDGANSNEQVDYGQLAGEVPLIKGKTDKEQNEELQAWKNDADESLVKMGINPLFLGDQWDNYFKDAGKSEKEAKAYRDRGVFGHIAGMPIAAVESGLQAGAQSLAGTVSAIPRLTGFEEAADAIDKVPSKVLPSARRDFNFQVDSNGRLITDEYGNPKTTIQGNAAQAIGTAVSFLLPTTALKVAGAPRYLLTAANISQMALQGANSAYQDTIANGGDRNQALLAAAFAVPINTADSFVNLEIISGGKAWLKGLGPLNKARAIGWQFMKQGTIGGSANALRGYLQDLGVSSVIDKDISSGERVFDQFLGGFVGGGVIGAAQAQYAIKPDTNLRPIEKPGETPSKVPPTPAPVQLPKETEHQRLTQVFEEFQKSHEMEITTNLRSPADLDPEHLALFGYKAEPLPGGKVRLTKEVTYQTPDVTAFEGPALNQEVTRAAYDLENTPHPDTFHEQQKSYDTLVSETRGWGDLRLYAAQKAKKFLVEKEQVQAQIKELQDRTPASPEEKAVIKANINKLNSRIEDIEPFIAKESPGVKDAETLRELEKANQTLLNMQDPRYANNLMAKDNYLKALVAKKQLAEAEAAKANVKEGEEVPETKLGIPIKTANGVHRIVTHDNKWHIFDRNRELVQGGFSTYGEAVRWAGDNISRPGRIGIESRMSEKAAQERVTPEETRFAEIKNKESSWTEKVRNTVQDRLADIKEAEYFDKRIQNLTKKEQAATSDAVKGKLREQINEYQSARDELTPKIKDTEPGVLEAKMLQEKVALSRRIKELKATAPTKAEAESTPAVPETREAEVYTKPLETRQPQKAPNVPLDNTFIPGKVIAATEAKEVNPRDIVSLGKKVLKTLSQYKRQATSAGYSPFSGAGRKLRTPEEAARLQRDHPLELREGGRGFKGALGFIDYLQRFIRADNYNDLPTIVHEITHAINTELFPEWSAFPQQLQEGLVKMGRAFYGDPNYDKFPLSKKLNEGWATFMEHYTSGQTVQKDVLDFYNGWLRENYPELHVNIENIKAKLEDYYKMDPQTYAKVFMGALPQEQSSLPNMTEFMDNWVDQGQVFHEMQRLSGDKVRFGDIFEANKGRARELAHDKVYGKGFKGWNNDAYDNGMSGQEAIAPAKGNFDKLASYMLAKYTLARAGQGKRTGFALDDAKKIVHDVEVANRNTYGDSVMQAHENLMNWYLNIMHMAAERSPYLNQAVNNIVDYNRKTTNTDHGYYMPMMREFAEATKDYGTTEGAKSANPFMRFKGSDRRIMNPLLYLEEHASKILNAAENRHFYDLMVNASRTGPLGAFITEVPAHMVPKLEASMQETLKAVASKLKEKYGQDFDISHLPEELLTDTITFFRPEQTPPRASDGYQTIAYRKPGGGVQFFEVNPRIVKALDSSMPDFTRSAWFQWMFTKPGRVMRIGATTARMAYQLRNIAFRDFFTAWRRGDEISPIPLAREVIGSLYSHFVASLTNEKTISPVLELEKSLGVYNATRAGAAREIEREIERASGKKVIGVVEKGFTYLENLLSVGEQATRTAALKLRAKQLGITDFTKPLTPEQTIELILAKKRSTTNFQVQGAHARVANLAIPFFTARIAELSQLKKDWKTQPGKQIATAGAYLTLGIATAFANKDEDWWKNLEPEEKSTNWMTTLKDSQGNNRIIRVPLETLAGVFHGLGNLIGEQIIRQDVLKPSMTEASWGLLKQYIPVSNALDIAGVPGKEFLSQEMNYDSFFKKAIVPKGLEEAPAHMQYTSATTELAKGIAGRLHQLGLADWSPARIDHAFRAIFPAGLDMIHSVENYTGVKPINDQPTKAQDFLINLTGRGGYKESVMDRSTNKFYETSDKFRNNKDIETPEEATARKKLDKIRQGVSDINTILSAETDADSRQQLLSAKRELLEKGIAIGEGDTSIAVGFSPYSSKAKLERQQRKFERAKVQASSKEEKSLFSE